MEDMNPFETLWTVRLASGTLGASRDLCGSRSEVFNGIRTSAVIGLFDIAVPLPIAIVIYFELLRQLHIAIRNVS